MRIDIVLEKQSCKCRGELTLSEDYKADHKREIPKIKLIYNKL